MMFVVRSTPRSTTWLRTSSTTQGSEGTSGSSRAMCPTRPPWSAARKRSSLVYNPNFINEVADATGNSWGPYSVMAHEIGHHLQGHTIQPGVAWRTSS